MGDRKKAVSERRLADGTPATHSPEREIRHISNSGRLVKITPLLGSWEGATRLSSTHSMLHPRRPGDHRLKKTRPSGTALGRICRRANIRGDCCYRRCDGNHTLTHKSESPPRVNLHSSHQVLRRASPVPAASGLYAWYFTDLPAITPSGGCLTLPSYARHFSHRIASDSESKPSSTDPSYRSSQHQCRQGQSALRSRVV
jgi:hypothetical protein